MVRDPHNHINLKFDHNQSDEKILGLPEVIVSDNANTFTSKELSQFLQKNGVRHVRTPLYHPATNRLAGRAVQTFKEGIKKMQEGSVETKLL